MDLPRQRDASTQTTCIGIDLLSCGRDASLLGIARIHARVCHRHELAAQLVTHLYTRAKVQRIDFGNMAAIISQLLFCSSLLIATISCVASTHRKTAILPASTVLFCAFLCFSFAISSTDFFR